MSHLLQLLALLSLMVAGAKLAGAAAVRVGQPAVFGEILIGLLLTAGSRTRRRRRSASTCGSMRIANSREPV